MRFCLLFLIGVSTALSLGAERLPQEEVFRRYTGVATMVYSDKGFYNSREPLVIRSQEDFEAFVTTIPRGQILKRETTQPSRDPLLRKPAFAWDQFMLLVVFDNRSLIFPPRVEGITVQNQGIKVSFRSASRADALETKPQNLGAYTAVLVKRSDRPILFEFQ